MQNNNIFSGVLMVEDHTRLIIEDNWLPCYILENDELVLPIIDFYEYLGLKIKQIYVAQSVVSILAGTFGKRNIKDLLNKKFSSFRIAVLEYEVRNNRIFLGELAKFEELCEIIIELGNSLKQLEPDQLNVVEKAEAFIKSSLAQGFSQNQYRPIGRMVTRTVFKKYLDDPLTKWTVTFPEEFYRRLFRFKGLGYPPPTAGKKISGIQHWVHDIIYSRLSSEVLATLHAKRPQMILKQLVKEFNYFNLDEYGHHRLYIHLSNVIFLMRCCTSWEDFKRRLDMSAPLQKRNRTSRKIVF